VQDREAVPAADDGVEDVVDVGPEKNLAARQIRPGDVRVLAYERDDFFSRELVGGLALPDVARLAAVLTPVREAEVQLERRRGSHRRGLEEREAQVRGPPQVIDQWCLSAVSILFASGSPS
jgi:hypothetical protein